MKPTQAILVIILFIVAGCDGADEEAVDASTANALDAGPDAAAMLTPDCCYSTF